jgi:hypothetical protein
LVVCRCDHRFLFVILVGVFYLESERAWRVQQLDKQGPGMASSADKKLDVLIAVQAALQAAALAVAALGCVVYIGQHRREYGGRRWSWVTFWLGVAECKGNGSGKPSSIATDLADGLAALMGGTQKKAPGIRHKA